MFVILTTAGALAMRRRWPAGLAVWVCYVATVLPVLGLAQSGQQIAADRYMYAPSLGLAVLVAGSSARLWRDSGRRALSNAAMIIAVLLAALSLLTWRYVKVWHDSESLWRRALDMDPAIASAHNNLGAALFGQGKLDEAIEHFDRALQLRPHYPSAHNNLGFALAGQGRLDEAVRHYRQALLINPQFAQARRNLEVVLQRSGPGTHDLRR